MSAALHPTADTLLHRSERRYGANSGREQVQQNRLLDHLVGAGE